MPWIYNNSIYREFIFCYLLRVKASIESRKIMDRIFFLFCFAEIFTAKSIPQELIFTIKKGVIVTPSFIKA
jgi:hypothetical protein